MLGGVVPHLNRQSLYVAIGILGATVMPHNLYLHSALVQTRHISRTDAGKRRACRYNLIDSVVALNGAHVGERLDPGAGRGGLLQARRGCDRNPAGA